MAPAPEKVDNETPAALVSRLRLPFKNLSLVTRALTHRSYLNEHPEALEDNERLEFLGDAVLSFVVGAWLYNHFPEMAEGELTRMRSALVCTEQLANFARDIKLGMAMRLGRGESRAGGRERDVLLCATFEALVGALYLSSGLEGINPLLYPLLEKTRADRILHTDQYDPKSRLQEWSQGCKIGIPKYTTVATSGPEHGRTFVVQVEVAGEVLGSGSGPSKQAAAREAAKAALQSIERSANQITSMNRED